MCRITDVTDHGLSTALQFHTQFYRPCLYIPHSSRCRQTYIRRITLATFTGYLRNAHTTSLLKALLTLPRRPSLERPTVRGRKPRSLLCHGYGRS